MIIPSSYIMSPTLPFLPVPKSDLALSKVFTAVSLLALVSSFTFVSFSFSVNVLLVIFSIAFLFSAITSTGFSTGVSIGLPSGSKFCPLVNSFHALATVDLVCFFASSNKELSLRGIFAPKFLSLSSSRKVAL